MKISYIKTLLMSVLLIYSVSTHAGHGHPVTNHQLSDKNWVPEVKTPEFKLGTGPKVLVDSAHGNFHTIDGRFEPFAKLLRADGYQIDSADHKISTKLLETAKIYVIANAVFGGDDGSWDLPTESALAEDEVKTLVDWVSQGGSLLLIADHMPFPGAVSNLAAKFNIGFLNGFAKRSLDKGGTLTFSRENQLLLEHPIINGRNEHEAISSIKSFTGQAFSIPDNAQALLRIPSDWDVYLPKEAWEFDETTAFVPANNLVQGAVLKYGEGRVAVFGEAAMFTAQAIQDRDEVVYIGMNNEAAKDNAQFVLNVMHWLSNSK